MAFSATAREVLQRSHVLTQHKSNRNTTCSIFGSSHSTIPFVLEIEDTFNLFGPSLGSPESLLDHHYDNNSSSISRRASFHRDLITHLAVTEGHWKLKLKEPLGLDRPGPRSQIWRCEVIDTREGRREFEVVAKMYIKSMASCRGELEEVGEIQEGLSSEKGVVMNGNYKFLNWRDGINRIKREVRVFGDAKKGQGREIPFFYGSYHLQLNKDGQVEQECVVLLMEYTRKEDSIPLARWIDWKGEEMKVIEFDEMSLLTFTALGPAQLKLKAAFANQHFFEKHGIAMKHNGLFDLPYFKHQGSHSAEPDCTVPLVAVGFGRVGFKNEILYARKTKN
ncbi:hypothetical protein JCM5350_004524 [Sporobolomyces pararoseus]